MIITRDFAHQVSACPEGITAADILNVWGKDSTEITKIFLQNGFKDFAAWVVEIAKSKEGKKFCKEYEYLRYLVFNPVKNVFHPASTLNEAILLRQKVASDNSILDTSTITIQEEMKDLEGTVHRFNPITVNNSVEGVA